jgi:2-aminoadipate transaminase
MSEDLVTSDLLQLSQRSRQASGQPISTLMAQALANPELISLAAGFVDQHSLPAAATQAALQSIFANPQRARAALQYGTTPGFAPLRDQLLARLRAADGHPAAEESLTIDQVVVTAGSNQLLHLVCETLMDPGDIVLCAAPSYFVFLGLLANLGIRSVGVAMDADGMIPQALDESLERLHASGELARVKAIYCTSYYDNPCSVSLSADRRPEIVQLARKWSLASRIHVIEDAAYRELRYEGEDLPSMRAFDETGEVVIHAGTFSKSYSPGIRVGWGVLPPDLVEPLCNQKGNLDFGSPNFAQHLMHAVIDEGNFDSHVRTLRESYRVKLRAMLESADAHLAGIPGVKWLIPQGGLYLWLTLPEGVDTGPRGTLFDRATRAGVLYVPGEYCYPAEGPRQTNTIRLSFGVQPAEKIRQGMAALAEAIGQSIR